MPRLSAPRLYKSVPKHDKKMKMGKKLGKINVTGWHGRGLGEPITVAAAADSIATAAAAAATAPTAHPPLHAQDSRWYVAV